MHTLLRVTRHYICRFCFYDPPVSEFLISHNDATTRSSFVKRRRHGVEDDATDRDQDAEHTVAADDATAPDPAEGHDGHGFAVAYYRAGYTASAGNDGELR